jgi:hypothetical protein
VQKDFKTISDVEMLYYENVDLSNLRSGGADVKAMRLSFKNNGIPAIGTFTVSTNGTNVSSAVDYIWGMSSSANEFEADWRTLLDIFKSIKYDDIVLQECRNMSR